jgi:hypothetical protein
MRPKLVVVALALVTGLAGCVVTPEYHDAYYRDGYYSYRYRDHDAYRHRYYSYSYNRRDPYGIENHQTN